MKCSLGISNFFKEISSLSHSIVFLYFFALITEEGFLIFPCYSLELCIQMCLSFLLSFAFCFPSFHSYLSDSSDKNFAFLHFFFLVMVLSLPPVQCHEPLSIVLQALCLSDLVPWIYLSLPLWFRSYLNGLMAFPTFFSISLNLAIRSSWSESQSAPSLVFAGCIELLHLWLQRI